MDKKPFLLQVWVVTAILINMFEFGVMVGLLSCLLKDIKQPGSSIQVSLEQASWIGTSFSIVWIPGHVITSYLMHKFGRRIAFLVVSSPATIGLLLMHFATNVPTLVAARILQGFTAGSAATLCAVMIGEYASPCHRGMFLSMKTAILYVGSTMVHALGQIYHWRTIALLSLIPHLINFVIIWSLPESPYWLASKKKFEECSKTFCKLRGKDADAMKELAGMIKSQQESTSLPRGTIVKRLTNFIQNFQRKEYYKPVIVMIFAMILLETTGRHVFPAYALQIISEISGEYDPFYLTLGLDILVTVSAFCSSALIRMAKRRTLIFSTGSMACLVLISVCVYLFLVSKGLITNIPWLPMLLFAVYFGLVNLVCAPIPLGLLGELFSLEHKASSTAIASTIIAIGTIASYQLFPFLLDSFKIYGAFFVFGVVMGISLICLYFTQPETKDKSLVEIEYYFIHGKFEEDCRKDEACVNMLPKFEDLELTKGQVLDEVDEFFHEGPERTPSHGLPVITS